MSASLTERDKACVTKSAGPVFGYIGGTSFSGSTLLSFLLNAQPGLTSIGEVAWSVRKVNPGEYPCSCGATLGTCQFWIEVSREMSRRRHLFDADHWNMSFEPATNRWIRRLVSRSLGSNIVDQVRDDLVRTVPGWAKHLEEIGERNFALADSITVITRASAFVDASKDPSRIRLLSRYSTPQLKVIHLLRDSPAFVNSVVKKGSVSLESGVHWWNSTAQHMERLRSMTPEHRWLRVSYENLCTNPEQEIKRVVRFFGVAETPPVLNFRSVSHHIIGNRMRLSELSEIRLDDSWRDELTGSQLRYIKRKTRKHRLLLGYSDDERTA